MYTNQSKFSSILFVSILITVSGCTYLKPVARQAVDYNRAVEQAQNQTVFLNIVRSMKRLPQHYTAISQLVGQATSSLSPSVNLTLANGAGSTSVSSLGGTLSSGASAVTVPVLDSHEFTKGILNPISLEQTEFFLEQGWPEELIGMLFVREIRILDDQFTHSACEPREPSPREVEVIGKPSAKQRQGEFVYTNEPDESASDPFLKVRCFGLRLAQLREEGLTIVEKRRTIASGLTFQDSNQLAMLSLAAHKEGLEIKAERRNLAWGPLVEPRISTTYEIVESVKALKWAGGIGLPKQRYESVRSGKIKSQEVPDKLKARFVFRSVHGVIYYLGEIMRAQRKFSPDVSFGDLEPKIGPGKDAPLLFLAREKSPDEEREPILSVKHGGVTYVIPQLAGCDDGQSVPRCHRSMQALAIVKQLIGLNKSRKDLPATGVVTVAGG